MTLEVSSMEMVLIKAFRSTGQPPTLEHHRQIFQELLKKEEQEIHKIPRTTPAPRGTPVP